jgi:asparagine N-glycosylation enzyme membrane subunit Stt3
MASTGDLNPHWFGHPGSTVIYSLAALYRVREAIAGGGGRLPTGPQIAERFAESPAGFYLIGRVLNVCFALLTVPFVYLLGRDAFGEKEGLVAAWLSLLSPIAVDYAQTVRTDTAAVFFGVVSLWLCLRLYDAPTRANQAFAGVAIGLAIATRYFMLTLFAVLFWVDAAILLRERRAGSRAGIRATLIGPLAMLVAFALTTPFFFLDHATVVSSIEHEARSTHPGADGLSFSGNLVWYVSHAIPGALSPAVDVLACAGIAAALWQRRKKAIPLCGFAVVFLVAISLSALHWQRWILQLLPLVALFAALGLVQIVHTVNRFVHGSLRTEVAALCVAVVAVSALPVSELVEFSLRQARPSTVVDAREWAVANLPARSKIAEEYYTAPLEGTDFMVTRRFSLAKERTFDDYMREGYDFALISSAIYNRYLYAPGRYPTEAGFYLTLFKKARLVKEIVPRENQRGPTVRFYDLRERSLSGSP